MADVRLSSVQNGSHSARGSKTDTYMSFLANSPMQTGNPIGYVKQEYFKRLCNPELFVRVEYDKLMHKEVERLRSSRDLDTGEMTTAIDRFRNWASMEAGINLPSPEDNEWISFIEREMQHQKVWL